MSNAMQAAVARQRLLLCGRLSSPFERLAHACAAVWPERAALEARLTSALNGLPFCKYIWVLDQNARQITANCTPNGPLPDHLGRHRADRPYLAGAVAGERFYLSQAYISRNARRPSLSAVQRIENSAGGLLGYLGADFDLRELPLTRGLYEPPSDWVQLKGDPAIRGRLFMQERVESLMGGRIDEALDLLRELIVVHGVFHGKLYMPWRELLQKRLEFWIGNREACAVAD